jgi:hypothetical protein
MQRRTRQDLARAMAPAEHPAALSPQVLFALPEHLANPWRLLFRGLRRQLHRVDRRLLVRLALAERITHLISSTPDPEENARRRSLVFLPSLEYWSSLGIKLPWQAILPLDSALHHLAWLDAEFSATRGSARQDAAVLSLSSPDKPALRRWFDGILLLTGCDDLVEFERYLAARGIQSRGDALQHGRLKKWASSVELMPNQQAVTILSGCGPQVQKGTGTAPFLVRSGSRLSRRGCLRLRGLSPLRPGHPRSSRQPAGAVASSVPGGRIEAARLFVVVCFALVALVVRIQLVCVIVLSVVVSVVVRIHAVTAVIVRGARHIGLFPSSEL